MPGRDPDEVDREIDAWFAARRKGHLATICVIAAVLSVAGRVWGIW